MSYSIIPMSGSDANDGPSAKGSPLNNLRLPTKLTAPEDGYFKSLLDILENGTDEDFLIKYSSIDLLKKYNDIQIKLFIKAIAKNSSKDVFEKILCNVTDIGYTRELSPRRKYETTIIEDVCRAGNHEAFKKLLTLKHLKLPKPMDILHTIISSLDENLFSEWFDFLLYIFKEFDVNEDNGKKALHTADSLGKKQAVRKLLEAGTYIGTESFFQQNIFLRQSALEPQDIKEYFDSCIGGDLTGPEKYITFNYKNLVPPKPHRGVNEMMPIKLILSSREHLDLIKHPLIISFMALKWKRMSKFLYLNLFLYCFYTISIVSYIVLTTRKKKEGCLTNLTWYLTIFGTAYLIIREAIQLMLPSEYLKKPSNYMEMLLIIFSIHLIKSQSVEKEILVSGIILIALEFIILVGNLPIFSFSVHMIMLKEVLKTFLKSFSLYAIFVFTFTLCFFVIFQEEEEEGEKGKKEEENKFENIFKSVVKTMAMVVGELNFEDLKLKGVYSYILILLFIICMPVVLVNLLIGLAVSDIQAIRKKAELNGLICRAKFLHNHDIKLFFPNKHEKNKSKRGKNRLCICKYYVSGVYINDEAMKNNIILPHECHLCHININQDNTNKKQWIWKGLFKAKNVWQFFDFWMGNVTEMKLSIVEGKTILMNKMQTNNIEQLKNLKQTVENIQDNVLDIYQKSVTIEKQVQNIEQNFENIHSEQQIIGEEVKKILKIMQKEGF